MATATPTTVSEQNFSVRLEQPRGGNRHAVFFSHPREAITYHYERDPADPRVQHATTLEVDAYGNVLKEAAIGYGRRTTIRVVDAEGVVQEIPNEALNQLDPSDREKQPDTLVTYTENRVTNPIDDVTVDPDAYRTPLLCETRTFELTGYTPTGAAERFRQADFVEPDPGDPAGLRQIHVFGNEIPYEAKATSVKQRRLIEHVRTLYRPDDFGIAQNDPLALLPLGTVYPLALPGESYKLAFTPGLLARVYQRPLDVVQPPGAPPPEHLLPTPADVLGGQGADRGGYERPLVDPFRADVPFPRR